MPKMIQVRNVKDRTHRALKARAAKAKMSLSDYLKRELDTIAARPTMLDWLMGVAQDSPIVGGKSAAQIIREMRDSR